MLTTRNVIIGFGLRCECVFFFPANVKGHQQALVYRHQNQCLCFPDYQQHCDCHKGQHGVCINRTARPIYYPVLLSSSAKRNSKKHLNQPRTSSKTILWSDTHSMSVHIITYCQRNANHEDWSTGVLFAEIFWIA